MKTKAKSIAVLGLLVMCMSSCVYSLFPIWTKDTLVYLPELEGKWQLGDDPEDYILFEPGFDVDATISVAQPTGTTAEVTKNISFTSTDKLPKGVTTKVTKNFSITYDSDEYILVEGDTVRDREKVKAYWEGEMDSLMTELGEKMVESLGGLSQALSKIGKGTLLNYSSDDQSYKMTVMEDGEALNYQVHLAQIGEDIFLDLYATESPHSSKALESMVWFPVHMFMKLELNEDRLTLTQFDLDKMNKLFDSNLIRIGHETVDGSVLITAKSEEIQKFFNKYSNDESVFDNVEVYERIRQ